MAIVATVLVGVVPDVARAADITIVVTSTGNGTDASGGSGACATSGGECTLRAAIQTANRHTTGRATINFAIPGSGIKTIQVPSALPTIDNGKSSSSGITIDGFTQAGSRPNASATIDDAVRTVELVGRGRNGNSAMLITGRNVVIRGLIMNSFSTAIGIRGEASQNTGGGNNNKIVGNLIGLRPDGTAVSDYTAGSFTSGKSCVYLTGGAGFNRIGTADPADRNTISGCYEKGILLENSNTFGNTIVNNIIGMDPSGTERRANEFGIDINGGAKRNIVGGLNPGEGNLLSGNARSAVEISHDPSTTDNDVLGNLIGTDPTGNRATSATRTTDYAIRLEGARIGSENACIDDAGLSMVFGNVIVNSGRGGIFVDKGFRDTTIGQNDIGITRDGTVVGNGGYGIRIVGGANNIIVRQNRIAGGQYGVQVEPTSLDPRGTRPCQTNFNTVSDNEMTGMTRNGIDLFPYGDVTDVRPPSSFVNQGVNRPNLFTEGGVVEARACAECDVELFSTSRQAGQNGLGVSLVASSNTGGDGVVTFAQPAGGWPARVTATATTAGGSTSEFSVAIVPSTAAQPTPPPTVTSVDSNGASTAGSTTVTVSGTGFGTGTSVTTAGTANGVTISSVRVENASTITFVVTVAAGAPTGAQGFVIRNGNGSNVTATIDIVQGGPFDRIVDRAESAGLATAERKGNRVTV